MRTVQLQRWPTWRQTGKAWLAGACLLACLPCALACVDMSCPWRSVGPGIFLSGSFFFFFLVCPFFCFIFPLGQEGARSESHLGGYVEHRCNPATTMRTPCEHHALGSDPLRTSESLWIMATLLFEALQNTAKQIRSVETPHLNPPPPPHTHTRDPNVGILIQASKTCRIWSTTATTEGAEQGRAGQGRAWTELGGHAMTRVEGRHSGRDHTHTHTHTAQMHTACWALAFDVVVRAGDSLGPKRTRRGSRRPAFWRQDPCAAPQAWRASQKA